MRKNQRRNDEKAIRRQFQTERPTLDDLVVSGQYTPPVPQGEYLQFVQAVARLRDARKAAGLSLAEIARRTGIDKAALSRLENGVADNPTINTINRYAGALGKSLELRIVEKPKPNRRRKIFVGRR